MEPGLLRLSNSQGIPFAPTMAYDRNKKVLLHLYQNIVLDPNTFQSQVSLYTTRSESFSGAVATVHRIQDERIAFHDGKASMEVTVVCDFVPFRLHLRREPLSYEQALFLLEGAAKGLRQLLHKIKTPFLVQKYMIGVDGNGRVRVWWNQHFFRNKFSFLLKSEFKLKDMVLSLIECLSSVINPRDQLVFREALFSTNEFNFVALEKKVQQMANGLKLEAVGKNLIAKLPEVIHGNQQIRILSQPTLQLSLSSALKQSNVRLIESPRTSRLEITPLVTKRTYMDGLAPASEKMRVIRQDIERLRESSVNRYPSSPLLKGSRSLTNVLGCGRNLFREVVHPQVMKQSQVVESRPLVSQSQFVTPSKANPEGCQVCSGVKSMRRSQITMDRSELNISRIKSLQNLASEREFYSTERSFIDNKGLHSKSKFGEGDKKLPESQFFSTLLP